MGFVLKVVVNALALAVAAWLVDGIRLTSSTSEDRFLTLLLVGLIFGLVNAFVRPIVTLLSLPFIILTLGLMIFVINALMLMLTGWLAAQFGLDFAVDGFWSAVWGAVIISIVTFGLELVVGDGVRDRR